MNDDETVQVRIRARAVTAHVMGMQGPNPDKPDEQVEIPFLRAILGGEEHWFICLLDGKLEPVDAEDVGELESAFQDWVRAQGPQ